MVRPLALILLTTICALHAVAQSPLLTAKRILFLGDSITYDGKYVAHVETELRLRDPQRAFTVVCCGLPSETVSGLSEAGHANGSFPRPDLHERLDRVLTAIKPDLVVACYGMNDGIYLPLADERKQAFQLGMQKLRDAVLKLPAQMIHLSPAAFDPVPISARVAEADRVDAAHPFKDYDDVLNNYAQWLQSQQGWSVIDTHAAMNQYTRTQRAEDPKFTLSPDGVHPNATGHIVLAKAVIQSLGANEQALQAIEQEIKDNNSKRTKLFTLVYQRQRLLGDAWLTHTGHKRPMKPGLPLEEALTKADEIDQRIQMMLQAPNR